MVALPKALDFGEVVSIDLKPLASLTGNEKEDRQTVYCVDEFLRFTSAGIAKSKHAEDVMKVLLKVWCFRYGYPTKAFLADNGTEFSNKEVAALVKRIDIKLKLGPSYSPWSNGCCERRHSSIDLTLRKLLEDDDKLFLEEALDHSVWALNMEVGRNGDTPFKVMTGKTPGIPGISDGNEVTDTNLDNSEQTKLHFQRQRKARLLFLQSNSDRRIKEALKSRTAPYRDRAYE